MTLFVIERATILAFDGPGVGGNGAVVVGNQIGGGGRSSSGLLGQVGVLRLQSDSGHRRSLEVLEME